MARLRLAVLLPALLPLLAGAAYALYDPAGLVAGAQGASDWLLRHFDWLFSWSTALFLVLLVWVYVSPLGRQTIGGVGAERLLSPPRWFAVTVCTTIATGILFWGFAEPIFHLSGPPPAGEGEPAVFALSTLFLHWTLTPYGIYTVGGLAFALGFYNERGPFSLTTLLGSRAAGGAFIDCVCLFALVAGMAASLGAGALSLLGGLGWEDERAMGLALIIGAIVLAFCMSSATGLQRGIRRLSSFNLVGFVLLAVFVFAVSPVGEVLALGGRAAVDFVLTFVPRNLGLDAGISTEWSHAWTAFYWANWFAWAPVTALFLGRLGRGYTVRRFIEVNLLATACFGALWMLIFGGGALVQDVQSGGALSTILTERGPEAIAYVMLEQLPWVELTVPFFLLLIFLSYVTAADSNLSAVAALCTRGVRPDSAEGPVGLKWLWGAVIGATSWLLVTYAGIDGIRLISTLGGFPAMILLVAAAMGLGRRVWGSYG